MQTKIKTKSSDNKGFLCTKESSGRGILIKDVFFVVSVFVIGIAILTILIIRLISGPFKKPCQETYPNNNIVEDTIVIEEVDDNGTPIPGTRTVHSSSEPTIKQAIKSKAQEFLEDHKKFGCRSTSPSKGEAACLKHMIKITGRYFCNVRPSFLTNPVSGGRKLELDCYNPDLKIAVEYQGRQHYEYVPFYHQNNIQKFRDQQRKDKHKVEVCKKMGIFLIVVPYWISVPSIPGFIDKAIVDEADRRKSQRNNTS